MPLKRNGELCKHAVPGFVGKLTPSELDTYNAAFAVIKDEFDSLERIKNDVKELTTNPRRFTIPDAKVSKQCIADMSEGECNAVLWDVRSQLLKLNQSQVFLCERELGTSEKKEYAVIELFKDDSAYAQANGNARVLATGHNAALVVQDYAANAEHTLHFMASNMVASAQKVVWERVASQNPSRVIRAISDRCAQAVGDAQNEIQAQILERKISQRQSIGQSV
jgi:hypothetical protein